MAEVYFLGRRNVKDWYNEHPYVKYFTSVYFQGSQLPSFSFNTTSYPVHNPPFILAGERKVMKLEKMGTISFLNQLRFPRKCFL